VALPKRSPRSFLCGERLTEWAGTTVAARSDAFGGASISSRHSDLFIHPAIGAGVTAGLPHRYFAWRLEAASSHPCLFFDRRLQ